MPNTLLQFNPSTVSEAHQQAVLIETQSCSSSSLWTTNPSRSRNVTPVEGAATRVMDTSQGGLTPRSTELEAGAPRAVRPPSFRCFGCSEIGHRQVACPQQNRRGLFGEDEPIYEKAEDEDDNIETEERVEGDKGFALVLQCNCFTPQTVEESWLRINIFRTTCTIRGKICRLVIDAGSCTNIISEEAVSKLALFTERNPTPYRLAWLNSTNETHISKHFWVPFSIGLNYKDLIYCDILPMDACHILLGRHWQYNRRTTHDGFTNTYSFTFEDKQITLLPSQDSTPKVTPCTAPDSPAPRLEPTK